MPSQYEQEEKWKFEFTVKKYTLLKVKEAIIQVVSEKKKAKYC
jgi:hypothetical protein